jgi:hypothetical protein
VTDQPTPSNAYSDAIEKAATLTHQRDTQTPQAVVSAQMAQQLRSRFHQDVIDAIVMLELRDLQQIAGAPLNDLVLMDIVAAMKARREIAGA